MISETPHTARSRFSFLRVLLWIVIPVLLLVGAYAIFRWWSSSAQETESTAVSFAPAQEDEFLIIIAPFRRVGGDPQPVGGLLANDLRQNPSSGSVYRVETLARAPDEAEVATILTTYFPRVLVTGTYDGVDILPTVHLQPPDQLPLPPTIAAGGSALAPFLAPVIFHLYAPQGLEKPLQYLQAWILGQSYFWQGQFTDALPHLQEAKRLLPRQAPIAYRGGLDAFASNLNWQLGFIVGAAQGNWQAARDLFNDALRLSPGDPAPALGLAAALAQLGDIDRAALLLRQTLRDHPDAWQIHFALAEIALQQGDVSAAFASYDKAISLLSGSATPADKQALANIYFNRGYYRLNHDDPEGALEDFQQSQALGRNDIYLLGNLGWAAYEVGDFETAVTATAAARQLAPDRPDLAFNEALHLLAAGQQEAAQTAYQEAIELTLAIDDVLTRSTYFGVAYHDLDELAARMPELSGIIAELQQKIDIANG